MTRDRLCRFFHQRDTFPGGQQAIFAVVAANANHKLVNDTGGTSHNIEMPECHRVERAGVKTNAHDKDVATLVGIAQSGASRGHWQ